MTTIGNPSAIRREDHSDTLKRARLAARAIRLRIGLGDGLASDSPARSPRIALVDGAIAPNCPALARASIELAWQGQEPDERADEHATLMASVIAGDGDGLLGLCPAATLINVAAVSAGLLRASDPDEVAETLERAIDSALAARAEVIVLGVELAGEPSRLAERVAGAIEMAARRGVRVVLPAGNSGLLHAPIATSGAVPVVAADQAGRPLRQATLSPEVAARGLLVPGYAIPAMGASGGLTLQAGSSFAAAIVVGAFGGVLRRIPHVATSLIWCAFGGSIARRQALVPPALDVTAALQLLVDS